MGLAKYSCQTFDWGLPVHSYGTYLYIILYNIDLKWDSHHRNRGNAYISKTVITTTQMHEKYSHSCHMLMLPEDIRTITEAVDWVIFWGILCNIPFLTVHDWNTCHHCETHWFPDNIFKGTDAWNTVSACRTSITIYPLSKKTPSLILFVIWQDGDINNPINTNSHFLTTLLKYNIINK